jgi:hypothetical protein
MKRQSRLLVWSASFLPVLTFDYFTEPQMAREVSGGIRKGSVADSPLTLRHKEGKLTDVLFNGSVYKDVIKECLGNRYCRQRYHRPKKK